MLKYTHTLISLFLSQWLLWLPDTSSFSLFCTQTIEWMGHMENFLEERVKTAGEQTAGWSSGPEAGNVGCPAC